MLDKWLKTILFNLFLAIKSELLFNFKLNRKTMCIPSCLTWNHVSFHCTVSWNHILNNSCKDMTDMRLTVSRWRTIIECICLSLFTIFNTFFKNVIFFPELLDLFFSINKIKFRRYLFVYHLKNPSFHNCANSNNLRHQQMFHAHKTI